MTHEAWNGQHPWFDEIIPSVKNGRRCLDIFYDFEEANEFFDEEFRDDVWQRLLIRYYPDSDTWEAYHFWDAENYVDAFPITLIEEETEEVNEAIRCLKEEGALDADDYNWSEL